MPTDDYKPGNPEYDYWNDKNLYPSLRHEGDNFDNPPKARHHTEPLSDSKITGGSVFAVIFAWMVIFAPFALFLTWDNWLVQVIFWGGMAIILLVFVLWLCSATEESCKD